MNNSEEEFDIIEKYLRGELSALQQKVVDDRIANDQEFAHEVQAHRVANNLVVDHALLQTRARMSDWHKENDSGSGWSKPLVGLSIIALTVTGYLFFDVSKTEETTTVEQIPQKGESKTQPMENKQTHYANSEKTLPEEEKPQEPIAALEDTTGKRPQTEFPVLRRKEPTVKEARENIPKMELQQVVNKACIESFSIDNLQFYGSCEGEIDGSITFSGSWLEELQPVAFSIDSGETYSEIEDFQFLDNGVYHPSFIDRGGCVFYGTKPIILTSESCESQAEIVINTTLNEYWEPSLNIRNARVFIRNSQGVLVYSGEMRSDFRWYGRSSGGVRLPMGNYVFIIESFGNNVKSGSITLLK